MKDYRKEEKIVQAYTSAKNNEEIYEMDFNCAEVVELMQIAVKNLAIHDVSQQRELLKGFMQYVNCTDTTNHIYGHLLEDYLKTL
jgi:hypothetical protein